MLTEDYKKPSIYVVIPCAGSGSRAATSQPKQYEILAGKPVIAHTLAAFEAVPSIKSGVLVLAPDDTYFETLDIKAPKFTVQKIGGNTRAASVLAGLQYLYASGALADDWVLVHDAARCLIEPSQIEALIQACENDAVGGLLALPMVDTLKHAEDGRSSATLERKDKWLAQTPQMFRLGMLSEALMKAGSLVTDEASAIEIAGFAPKLVQGSARNIKITYPADFTLAKMYIEANSEKSSSENSNSSSSNAQLQPIRIGQGWDVHQLVDSESTGRKLILGGVTIPYDKGLLGHSDADALLHAITDALLGAAGLGDIGKHFPDTNIAYKGADSKQLLREAHRLVQATGYRIGNVDATIIAQAPKLAPFISAIVSSMAQTLGLDASQVNIKAKTAEKLGPVGEGRSIETQAVVLLYLRS